MNPRRVDALARSVATRRRVVRLAGVGAGLTFAGRAPAPTAAVRFGCSKQRNACRAESGTSPCPDLPSGTCVMLKRKPTCASDVQCHPCQAHADCVAYLGVEGAKCVRVCPGCASHGSTTACILPAPHN